MVTQTPEKLESPEMNQQVSQQIQEIIERSEAESACEEFEENKSWVYRVPCAGVRYYSF